MSVSIQKAILHILDTSLGMPVLSENLMSFNDNMREYTAEDYRENGGKWI